MSAIQASAAAAGATASTGTTTDSSTTASSTASTDAAKKSFATLFADAEHDLKKGEKLTKVAGHEFARIKGGTRDDLCINLSGNERSGQAFELIWRDGRQFHVYGTGADHKIVEVGHKAAATPAAATTTTPSAAATPAAAVS
jgi:hypothetical protein